MTVIIFGLVFIAISFLPNKLVNQVVKLVIAIWGRSKETPTIIIPGRGAVEPSLIGDIALPLFVRGGLFLVGLIGVVVGAYVSEIVPPPIPAAFAPTPTLMSTFIPAPLLTLAPTNTSTVTSIPTHLLCPRSPHPQLLHQPTLSRLLLFQPKHQHLILTPKMQYI